VQIVDLKNSNAFFTTAKMGRQSFRVLKQHSVMFLPLDATQSAVMLRQFVRLPVRDVDVLWSHRLEIFENNFTVS